MSSQMNQQQSVGMGQQSMNMGQSNMMAQGGMPNQQTVINPGMGGQQQMNTVNLQGHHTSRSPSQARAPSVSPHSNVGANPRTTPLSGQQVQMVSPPGAVMHGNLGASGTMMPGQYNRAMGSAVPNPVHGMNYTSTNPNQMTPNQAVMGDDNLEKYVTND